MFLIKDCIDVFEFYQFIYHNSMNLIETFSIELDLHKMRLNTIKRQPFL